MERLRRALLSKVISIFLSFLLLFYDFIFHFSFVYADGPFCIGADSIQPPPQINDSGFCEVYPLKDNATSLVKCPEGYMYNPQTKKCVSAPYCTGASYYDRNTRSCKNLDFSGIGNGSGGGTFLPPSGGGYLTDPNKMYCIGNSSSTSVNETFVECEKTDNGSYLCPVGRYQCDAKYQMPECSNGTVYNSTTKRCEAPVQLVCPNGTDYNPITNRCEGGSICPQGSVLNPQTDKCEAPPDVKCSVGSFNYDRQRCEVGVSCPSGANFDSSADVCWTGVSFSCPSGFSYNSATGRCEVGGSCSNGVLNYSTGYCEAVPTMTCPYPFIYDSSRGLCVVSAGCPSGLSFDSARNVCYTYPSITCPSGGNYNSSTKKCEAGAIRSCPAGSTYNPSTGKCETSPTVNVNEVCENLPCGEAALLYEISVCATPSSPGSGGCRFEGFFHSIDVYFVNPTTYCITYKLYFIHTYTICETLPASCPSGFTYNSATGKCETSVQYSCPSGYTYNPSTGKCEVSPNIICPSGTYYNSATGRCESSPQCPSGSSYNSNTKQCEMSPSINCPSGMTYSSSLGKCIAYPQCPSGSSYDFSRRVCYTSQIIICPSGMTYNPSRGRCEGSVQCPSGFSYDAVNNVCYGQPQIFCPSGTSYSTTYKKCLGNPTCPSGTKYDASSNLCLAEVITTCPAGTIFDPQARVCFNAAVCPPDTELTSEGCLVGYGCPAGPYPCLALNGKYYCSSNQCFSGNETQVADEGGPSGFEDDGERDESGNCLGTVLIFNGKQMRCREYSGIFNGENCCNKARGRLYDSTGSLYGTYSTIRNAITALAFATKVAKLGYYAKLIYEGKVIVDVSGITTEQIVSLMTPDASRIIFSSPASTAEAKAIVEFRNAFTQGQITSVDQAVGEMGKKYFDAMFSDPKMKAQITTALISLAAGLMIDDPVLKATVDVGLQIALYAMGAGNPLGLALAVTGLVLALMSFSCDEQDILTATFKESGYCHYVGYKEKSKLFSKIKTHYYCCFNSKLARIIHQQGRTQLSSFGPSGGWGKPGRANCRGFTPEEFQALDFGKIDLSEYYADIQRNIQQNINQMIQNQLQETELELKK